MIAGFADVDEAIRILQAKQIFVGLTERFDESLVLLKGLVAPGLNLGYRRINAAPNNAIAKGLLSTDRTRQILVDANQADLNLYNYVKSELYPALQAQYGPSLQTDVEEYQQTRADHFNRLNLTLSRLKQYMIYKPLLRFYRSGVAL
jgi:hypothetical protein